MKIFFSPAAWDSSTAWRFTASMPWRSMTDEKERTSANRSWSVRPRIVEVIR